MNLPEVLLQIQQKHLDKFYIFTGDEIAIQKIYIEKMANIKGLEIQYSDSYASIQSNLKSYSIFGGNKLYVILDDLDFIKTDKSWDNMNINDNLIIFKYSCLDKRSKFYKHFESSIIEFNKLSTNVLIKYIQKDLKLNNDNCIKLVNICGNNYNQILLEMDKLKNYRDYTSNTEDTLGYIDSYFTELNALGAFHKDIPDITFEFITQVLTRNIPKVYSLYDLLKQLGENNLKLLSLLYTNFKTILLIQSCKSNDICKTTGLQYYQVKYNTDKTNYYSIGELLHIIRLIQKIELGIKTGTIDEAISLDYLLVNIL